MCAALTVKAALEGKRCWWVAPTYKIAAVGWREIRGLARQIPEASINETDKRVEFERGSVEVRSADNHDGLRGEGLDLAVLEECGLMLSDVWNESLRPALADRKGAAIFIGTPKGRNFFWNLFNAGNDPSRPDWKSFHAPTVANPFIDPKEIEAARKDMPERKFRQEHLAEFIEDGAGVFRRVSEAATATSQDAAIPGHSYSFGVDWGKSEDFTVITVLDETTGEVVAVDRFNQIDYAVQRGRLMALAEKFAPTMIVAETNSIGVPVIEQLMRDGLPMQGFTTTNASKAQAIDALTLAFERGEIRIPPDPVLVAELQAFEMERLPSGMLRYSAPDGGHDDCVMSLAFAWHAHRGGGREFTGFLDLIRSDLAAQESAA